jgi:hypothetical protein
MVHAPRQVHRQERDQVTFAIVLIALGVLGVIAHYWQPSADIGGWVVMAIGLGFVGLFAYSHAYRYSIPGGIMTGLGAGIVASQSIHWTTGEGQGGAVVLGLGLGFLSILALQLYSDNGHNRWWPVIPGGILTTVGAALLIGGQAVQLLDWWGIALVAIGLLVLWRAIAGRRPEV